MREVPEEERRPVSFRIPLSEFDLLDALAAHFTRAADGVIEYSRTDVFRLAIRKLAEQVLPDPAAPPKSSPRKKKSAGPNGLP